MPETGLDAESRYLTTRDSASAWPKSDPSEPCLIVHRGVLPDLSTPHPLHVLADGWVGHQEFWKGEPQALWGFQEGATQGVVLRLEQCFANPEAAVGLVVVLLDHAGAIYALPQSAVVKVEHGSAPRHWDETPYRRRGMAAGHLGLDATGHHPGSCGAWVVVAEAVEVDIVGYTYDEFAADPFAPQRPNRSRTELCTQPTATALSAGRRPAETLMLILLGGGSDALLPSVNPTPAHPGVRSRCTHTPPPVPGALPRIHQRRSPHRTVTRTHARTAAMRHDVCSTARKPQRT